MQLGALERLAAGEREAGVREDPHALEVARLGELGERVREEVVARGRAAPAPCECQTASRPASELGAVDQVVVHERGRVHELDRDAAAKRALAIVEVRWTSSGRSRLPPASSASIATRATTPGCAGGRLPQTCLELVEIRLRLLEDRTVPSSRPPHVQRDDAAGEQPVAHVREARAPKRVGQVVAAGKAPHARGQVGVGGAARAAPCPRAG